MSGRSGMVAGEIPRAHTYLVCTKNYPAGSSSGEDAERSSAGAGRRDLTAHLHGSVEQDLTEK